MFRWPAQLAPKVSKLDTTVEQNKLPLFLTNKVESFRNVANIPILAVNYALLDLR
jgi:hypothetical protein